MGDVDMLTLVRLAIAWRNKFCLYTVEYKDIKREEWP